MEGELYIAIGPMFAGKSSWLISMIQRQLYAERTSVIIKLDDDTRYVGEEPLVSTHNHMVHDAIRSPKDIMSVFDKVKSYDVIGIDEGQFFTKSIVPFVKELVDKHKKIVYIASLDGTWKAEKFGHALDLIPMCNDVIKLKAVCMQKGCRNNAIFTRKLCGSDSVEEVGGADKYEAVCRGCFHSFKRAK